MKKKILIVGGTGFIGFHLLKSLKNKCDVYSLSKNKPNKERKIEGVKYLFCDIFNKNLLYKKLKKKSFNYVINLGGYVDHSNKKKTLESHYYGCKNLIDYFKNKNIKKFIQIGSSLEYGKKRSPHSESLKGKPIGVYGKSKLKSTKYLIKSNKRNNFPFIVLRLYQVYGPNQSVNRLIPIVITSCLKNQKFKCSNGKQLRDFIYVKDLINLINKIIFVKKKITGIFNVGSGKPVSVKSIIRLINKRIKKGFPQYGKVKMRKDESDNYYPRLNKIKNSLKWKATTSLNFGLFKTIKFYNEFR